MAGQFFLLRQVADFAPGFFENTVLEDDCIQLSHRAGVYAQSGSYTSVPFQSESFFSLIPSWNADTPEGTAVDLEVRLAADGQWSRWFSFGRWSPYIDRASPPPEQDGIARASAEGLELMEGQPAATVAQLRIFLYSDNERASPKVRLLAVTTNATKQIGTETPAFEYEVSIPAYSCMTRDPAMAGRNGSLTTLTMMMNRWGRDLLPEEVARVSYDSGAGRYGNLSFLCAAAGMYGFWCALSYAGIDLLRREVWQGRAVGARVRYRAPALGNEGDPEQGEGTLLPVLEGATQNSSGHLVAVCGFVQRDGKEYVAINDPMAPNDLTVRREIPLSSFSEIYTGIALYLQKGPRGAGAARPVRRPAVLDIVGNALKMFADGEELVPAKLTEGGLAPATLCYTLSDGVAYASAAQRKFYYPQLDEHGVVRFDASAAAGKKLTLYLIGPTGAIWVAEKLHT